MDFGLFPASEPAALVLVESSESLSGYGSRRLSARELGDLWDVPILLLDSLSDAEVTGLMEGICQSPPSKLLHTGADLLLTAGFRGGSDREGRGLDREGRSGTSCSEDLALLPGPCPLTDNKLGLCPLPNEALSPETQGDADSDEMFSMEMFSMENRKVFSSGVGARPNDVDEDIADDITTHTSNRGDAAGVRTQTQEEPETPNDKMIKGDHQKADNAAVPDHLWL